MKQGAVVAALIAVAVVCMLAAATATATSTRRRRAQYYGPMHWDFARPLLQQKIGGH